MPPKATPVADKEETSIPSDKKEDPAAMKENNLDAASSSNISPTIPGLPEEARLKDLKVTRVRKTNPKRRKMIRRKL